MRAGDLFSKRAYLTGRSFILQLVLATLLGLGFVIKAYWKKLVALFKRRSDEPEEPDDE
jgi:hypothetical protein